jgi:hypothetical protein
MSKYIIVIAILFISGISFAQQVISGKVYNEKTNAVLSYVTVKVLDSTYSTTSDRYGNFILHLNNGKYRLFASHIGYYSDTVIAEIDNKDAEINIYLNPSDIYTEEIQVYGVDPAYEIIQKAIDYKKKFKKNLKEYNYDTYTKYVIRSNINSIKFEDNTDTANKGYGIFGILESVTKGYVKQPDLEKQIVISKKETANISRGFAIPFVLNFYDEEIELGESGDLNIPTPLSDDCFDDYEYKLKSISFIDSTKIFRISVINKSENVPQFKGEIYILDSVYSLMKVNLNINEAGLMRGFSDLTFSQKFNKYTDKSENEFYLPTDIVISATGSFAGFIKFKGDVFTVVTNYNLNVPAPAGTFNDIIVKVMPDAEKDSAYWKNNQTIRNTNDELTAYSKIESKVSKLASSINFGLNTVRLGKNFYSVLNDYYNFNRVEGHVASFNLGYTKDIDKINLSGSYSYGFSDKKPKFDLSGNIKLLKDKSLTISAGTFNKIKYISSNPNSIYRNYNTFISWADKTDEYDYYYSSGWNFGITKKIIPQLTLGLIYSESKQTSAKNNSDFSLLNKSKKYRTNPPVIDCFSRTVGANLTIDPNKYKGIDWGNGEISRFSVSNFPVIYLGYSYSSKPLLSTFDFRKYYAILKGKNYFNRYLNLSYEIGGIFFNGDVPYQSLGYLRRYLESFSDFHFNTSVYQEFIGDKIYYLHLKNNFGKLLWGFIPVLNNFDLSGILNIGRTEISDGNKNLNSYYNILPSNGYYAEAGFSIDNILDILNLNFTWRLNNFRTGSNFNFTVDLAGF